jgi:glycolate oxidase FAD binding subunit
MDRSVAKPHTAEEALELVRQALGARTPLHLYSGRSKDRIGCQTEPGTPLDGSGLAGIVSYEPRELILVARPGTPLSQVEKTLADENQHLPFEPPAWGPAATLGGTVACNLSGPRRFKAGALRDYVLGVEMVTGHGERVRAGGKVVKNVSGYDLSKVLSGSFGTLGLLTEICLKVWPQPESNQTLVVRGLEPGPALNWIQQLAGLPYEITGLAYTPVVGTQASRVVVRLEGSEAALKAQLAGLDVPTAGDQEVLEGAASIAVWQSVREIGASHLAAGEERWRFVLPSNKTAALLEAVKPHQPLRYWCDWAGGLLWMVFPSPISASVLHQLALEYDAVAWRIGTDADDLNTQAFTPLAAGVDRLNKRLKEAFDPHGIFNPGRLG